MTFYDVWVNVKNGSIAKRMTDEKGSLESVFIKFENNRIYKKFKE